MTAEAAVAVREPTAIERVREALEARTQDIGSILPPSMDPARFIRVSLLAISKNPGLIECDRSSLIMSIIEAAEVGLEPTGGVGGAHLVPFKDKSGKKHAQLIYDYRGVQFLIREGGGGEVETTIAYEGEPFRVVKGTNPRIEHEILGKTIDPTKILAVYAVAMDSGKFEVMWKEDIDRIRARSKAANAGPWVTDYGAMSRKSVLKRLSAWLPLKPSVRAILDQDTEREVAIEAPTETVKSRTAEVREKIRGASGKRRQRPVDAPGAPDKAATPDTAAPTESAQQQPENAPMADAGVVEGESREVCGEGSDPKLGDVETCVLPPGHLAIDGAPQRHQGKSGAVWPAVKATRG